MELHYINPTFIEKEGSQIGHGSFGTVYKCKLQIPGGGLLANRTVAVKYIKMREEKFKTDALKEFSILADLGEHHHVVQVYGYFIEQDQFAIVMEFVGITQESEVKPCSSLYQVIQQSNVIVNNVESQIDLMIQAAEAVDFLHSRNILH